MPSGSLGLPRMGGCPRLRSLTKRRTGSAKSLDITAAGRPRRLARTWSWYTTIRGLRDPVLGVGRERSIVTSAVRAQLLHEPVRESRNRKPLRPNPLAPWELRAGSLRVFYEVIAEKTNVVNILAIGIKKGNRLLVAGEEIRL